MKKDISTYTNKAYQYLEKLSEEGDILLMLEYSKNEEQDFWNYDTFKSQIDYAKNSPYDISDIYDEMEVDFENDIVF